MRRRRSHRGFGFCAALFLSNCAPSETPPPGAGAGAGGASIGATKDASSGQGEAGTATGIEAGGEVGSAPLDVGRDSSLSPRDASVEEGAPSGADARNVVPAPCSAPGLLFCDDFEGAGGAQLDPAKWGMQLNGGGTLALDSTIPARSGSHSVHVTASGYQTFFVTKGAPAFPAPGGKIYLRAFIRLAAEMPAGHNTYISVGMGYPGSDYETRIGVQASQLMLNQTPSDRGALSNPNYYTDHQPGVQFPPGSWKCLEVLLDASKSEIDVWVDDREVPGLHLTDWRQAVYDTARFGYEKYAGPEAEIWYDDIAIGAEHIGCK